LRCLFKPYRPFPVQYELKNNQKLSKLKNLKLLLGDQLNHQHSWFDEKNDDTLFVIMEMRQETDYVRHHIQKVVSYFLAMRHFAEVIENKGFQVKYFKLDDVDNCQNLTENLHFLIQQYDIQHFEYQLPDEYRLDEQLKEYCEKLNGNSITTKAVGTEHFLSERTEVYETFKNKKTYLMETFYRNMRRKYHILMEDDGKKPLTGKWNYDAENRKKLPKKITIPPQKRFFRNVEELVKTIESQGVETIGRIDAKYFDWAVTREESLAVLEDFIKLRLLAFGKYQDAMTERDTLIFHSKVSFAMNVKLLHPLEVVNACVDYWRKHQDTINIAQIEGFVRQIIGWREYMRGVYWAKMPEFATRNFFENTQKLPDFFWTGKTKMNCVGHAVNQSLDTAYAHHIQRLMVTGNFAALLGVHPDEVDAWYLGIYMDAIEWVEITNTRGMSQFADGGLVGTKPYVASANYMHKMGEYCTNCQYDRKVRYGQNACPLNSLYWDFYDRNRDKLEKNPRIGMMYRILDKMDGEELAKILEQASIYKENVESL
jgi:deoxyribodipyrimidine photolyase-related protein